MSIPRAQKFGQARTWITEACPPKANDCSSCATCNDDWPCLQLEGHVLAACTPSRLADLLVKVAGADRAVGLLPPVNYLYEINVTNVAKQSVRLQHAYSSLALMDMWSSVQVRQLDSAGTVSYPIADDGDLLGLSGATGATAGICLESCESISLRVALTARCEEDCGASGPRQILGALTCTQLADNIVLLAQSPCDQPEDTIRKQLHLELPV